MNIQTDVNTKVDNHTLIMLGIVLASVIAFGVLVFKMAKR